MNGALALAGSIVTMDRATLARLVSHRIGATRAASSLAAIEDPLTLALDLLRSESISAVLAELDRASLAVLHRLGADQTFAPQVDEVQDLLRLGLIGLHEGRPTELSEVTDALEKLTRAAGIDLSERATPSEDHAIPASSAGRSGERSDWFVSALTATQQVAAMLRALTQQPGKVNRRSTVAVVTAKTLAEHSRSSIDTVMRVLPVLGHAGLTETHPHADGSGARLIVGARAQRWFRSTHGDRWLTLAAAQLSALSPQVRRAVDNSHGDLREAAQVGLAHMFPLIPQQFHDEANAFVQAAEELGLATAGRLTEVAQQLLIGDDEAARELTTQHMPPAVSAVYVQPDLSVVVPGPLDPHDEHLLTSLANTEQVGVASTLRITADTLARALDSGNSAEHIRAELERLSLTGVPQPVSFLLDELEQRESLIVHAHHGDEGRTRIDVMKPALLETLQVDRSLHHLQLTPGNVASASTSALAGPSQLFSRLSHEHVLTTLLDARYPAAAARPATPGGAFTFARTEPDAAGTETDAATGHSGASADSSAGSERPTAGLSAPLQAVVDRVSEAAQTEPGTGDVARRLDLAIRDRRPVRLTAAAQGQERDFTLLPVSLSRGRLRATDVTAGVERTLPLSAIVSVVPAT